MGLNTPTLKGLWFSAPYLHHGGAATLAEVLENPIHMGGALTTRERADLEAYLLQNRRPRDQLTLAAIGSGGPAAAYQRTTPLFRVAYGKGVVDQTGVEPVTS